MNGFETIFLEYTLKRKKLFDAVMNVHGYPADLLHLIPEHIITLIKEYVYEGKPFEDDFLEALFANDLQRTIARADTINLWMIPIYSAYIHNKVPYTCHGSYDSITKRFMKTDWMLELQKEENREEFSQLTHNYYKLATMRVMQFLRKKYSIPPEEIPTVTLAVFARMLNEACYSVGANLKADYPITSFYSKEQLLNLLRVLNGESLDQLSRLDIDMDIQAQMAKFQQFIIYNASNFYVEDKDAL